jgi:ribosome-associated toxin RatA of RatAB toxin-antitoxin module
MTIIKRSITVPYSTEQMYALVNDIESYPQFLPWCVSATVLSQDEDEVHATLILSYGGLRKAFTTCNRLQKNKIIEIRLVDGPLSQLEGFWRFEATSKNASEVTLDLEFEIAHKLLNLPFQAIFHQVTSSLVDAFHQRAMVIYG